MKNRLIVFIILMYPSIIGASHILGGFMTYEYLGGNEYYFEMRLYNSSVKN